MFGINAWIWRWQQCLNIVITSMPGFGAGNNAWHQCLDSALATMFSINVYLAITSMCSNNVGIWRW